MSKSVLVLSLVALGSLLAGPGSCQPGPSLAAAPGLPQYQHPLVVPVPGAFVHAAGNNLHVTREDLSLETRIGGLSLGAVYDAAGAGWLWSFQMTYDGATLVDASGARLSTVGLAPGEAIPGTWWVVLGADRVKTKGGLVHRFGADGRLESIHWASDAYPRVEARSEMLAGAPRITRLEQCTKPGVCSWFVRMEYDALGRLEELRDAAGRTARFAWDAEGRLVQARDALDVARGWDGFRYEYDGARLSALTNSEGERVEFSEAGNVLEVRAIGEENPTWRFERFAAVDGVFHTRVTDPLGHVRTLHYDGSRRLLRAVDPVGDVQEWAWEGRRPVQHRAADGSITTWVVVDDDVVLELQPAGNAVQISYAPAAVERAAPLRRPLLRVEDALGVIEARSYDAAGRLVARTDGAGDTATLAYDEDGQLATLTAPDGTAVGLSHYGDHGHPQNLSVDGTKYSRSFDAVGNLVQRSAVEREHPGVLGRTYDEDRNVVAIQVAFQAEGFAFGSAQIAIDRRSDGQRLAIARPGLALEGAPGPAASYQYDALGRLVERLDRSGGAWRSTRFEWDAAGRPTAVERPNTLREERVYDGAGRVTLRVLGRGTPFVPETAVSYSWLGGRLVELSDAVHGAPERYAYDAFGRLAQVTYPQGETAVPAWDARGRLSGLALADGSGFALELGIAYDGAGREAGLWLDGTPLEERSFAQGRLVEVAHGNGLVRSFAQASPLERSSETRDAGGALVARTSATEVAPGGAAVCVDLEVETFVGLAELVSESHCLGSGGRMSDGGEYWDGIGDPLAWGSSAPFVYGPDEALVVEGAGHSYAYDAAGFATARDGEALTYDAAGRPASVGTEHAFVWDSLGRLVSESTPQGTALRRFGGLVEADAAGTPRAVDLGAVRVDLIAGDHRFRHFDPRGNVAFVSDPAGAVRTVYRYGAFGVAEVRGAADDPVRFARGRPVGDLVLLGSRLLDPDLGRFLSPDPIYQLQSQYSYAWGDSLFFWDPSGYEGTLHGFTAGQLAAAFTFAGLAVAPYAGTVLPAAAIPMTSVIIGAWLGAVSEAGGFHWEGDRTIGDLLGRGAEIPLEGPTSPDGPLGNAPNPQNRWARPPPRGEGDGPRLHLPDGTSIRLCAPTHVAGGGRSSALWALACVNLLLGAALVVRACRTRP